MKSIGMKMAGGVGLALLLGAAEPNGCGGTGQVSRSGARSDSAGSGGESASFHVRAKLSGFQETPSISTTGNGRFTASATGDGTAIEFELTYADLQGVAGGGAVTGAHVHLGQRGVAGGIVIHLCGTGGRAACPPAPATVTGTISAADVVNLPAQGIAAGDLAAVLRAARAGVTYVNVHTTAFPTGEIRGQLRARGDDDEGEDHDRDDDD